LCQFNIDTVDAVQKKIKTFKMVELVNPFEWLGKCNYHFKGQKETILKVRKEENLKFMSKFSAFIFLCVLCEEMFINSKQTPRLASQSTPLQDGNKRVITILKVKKRLFKR
ncbi:MAG: hypothetical protein U9N34_07585, partial [Candidatus Cloacimonadota bacterium]|nr:hypothetical protein [Candidatus Cloacimonadota bacterium]